MGTDPAQPERAGERREIEDDIRTTRVSEVVSKVATNTLVRPILQQLQRDLIDQVATSTGGVVAEGRDITTVVAPDADVRVLLTASVEARLRRRSKELHGHAADHAVEATRDQIVRRDADDSTVSDFMEAAEGVTLVDTSDLDFEQSVAGAARRGAQRGAGQGPRVTLPGAARPEAAVLTARKSARQWWAATRHTCSRSGPHEQRKESPK